jgi:hypothetical protein
LDRVRADDGSIYYPPSVRLNLLDSETLLEDFLASNGNGDDLFARGYRVLAYFGSLAVDKNLAGCTLERDGNYSLRERDRDRRLNLYSCCDL